MKLGLDILPDHLAVCWLPADADLPDWCQGGTFHSATRTPHELSIVCDERLVPNDVLRDRVWRALRVRGTMGFSEIGVLAGLAAPLAAAEISIFVLSTFETDYLMVHDADLQAAVAALRAAGYDVADA
jgi:hypothetical protein